MAGHVLSPPVLRLGVSCEHVSPSRPVTVTETEGPADEGETLVLRVEGDAPAADCSAALSACHRGPAVLSLELFHEKMPFRNEGFKTQELNEDVSQKVGLWPIGPHLS